MGDRHERCHLFSWFDRRRTSNPVVFWPSVRAVMTSQDVNVRTVRPSDSIDYIRWTPVIAGALAAAALAFVLHGFAAAVGLAVSSTAPTWRDASIALWLLSGIYLIAVALTSYGLGGYIAGRMRTPFRDWSADDVETRDGAHGL